ncbi:hypothetical protein [Corynebacterium bovis]|uniref:hypothetical protein n=1 Tax=Corynebacterium bovis TaxID=36808 RepID=UPI002650B71E|nr:hypothetical protein [Corynebacterium bovis]MDN8579759.1 hypothetical protein [Corynebacterium bovis]
MDTRTSDLRPPQPLRTGDRAPRVTRLRRATLATIAAVGVLVVADAEDVVPLGTSLMHRDMNSSDSVPWSGPGQGQAVK